MADWWTGYPWRLIQTNLREIDMLDIRANRVVEDLQAFKATVLMINAAGIIASYPTKLPYHFQSPYLTGDSLLEILDACHTVGIRVIARTDFSKIRRPVYESHPDWAYLNPQGKIVDYNGDVHACVNSPYQQEYMLRILDELLSTHPFDGIFFNMSGFQTYDYSGNYYGICHCANCRRKFWDMFDLELPKAEDPGDEVYRKYLEFQRIILTDHRIRTSQFLTERWPELCIANHLETSRGFIRQESNTALNRPLPHWQYSGSENTRWAVGSYPGMVSSNTTVDFIDFPYRHVAVSPHQQALRLVQNLANGGAIDYYLIGRLDNHEDRSGFEAIKGIFHYHAANEDEYQGLRSKAGIVLLIPVDANQAEYRGWFRMLVENHFLFDVITEEMASSLPWKRYQAILLPGMGTIGADLAGKLDQFVDTGGKIIVSGIGAKRNGTSHFPEQTELNCLGIERLLSVRQDMRSTYLKFTSKAAFPRFMNTDLVFLDGPYTYAEYDVDTELSMHLIPPHQFGPPERCYYEQETDHPGFTRHIFGHGLAVNLPWLPGALFYRHGYPNTADFMADLLQGVTGLKPVGGNLPPMVEVTRFEQAGRHNELVHLVNTTGNFGNSFYSPIPLHQLEITMPCLQPPSVVKGLYSMQEFDHTWTGENLEIQIPRLELFEAIKINYPEA